MSITPIDEPRSDRPVAADAEVRTRPLSKRIGARVRSVVASLPFGDRLLEWRDREETRPETHTDALADDAVSPPECPSVQNLPDRQLPFSYPTRNHPERNPVDLICIESDDAVTISLPENKDATITSDVWEQVEP